MIRVLLFDHTAALGGGEIALANLVRYFDLTKVKPMVVLAAEGPLVERLRGVAETYVLPLDSRIVAQKKDKLGMATLFRIGDGLRLLSYVLRLARFIRAHDVDVVHTNSLKSDIIGGLAGRLAFRPVVWHVRDRIHVDYLPRRVTQIFRWLSRVLPSFVIANSAATMRTLLPSGRENSSTSSLGASPLNEPVNQGRCRMVVVYDGTDIPLPQERKDRARGGFRIGLVGRISPWKGQHIFIRAAALVNRRFPEARFVIIGAALFGESQYETEVRRLAVGLNVQQLVEFTGFRADIGGAIADLDLLVHASTKGEPFGQVIIEGMAAGKPVVATNGGGVPEIVEDGVTGILVPMGDATAMAEAICQIISDPVGAEAMGARGRQRVIEHFSLEKTARGVEAVYADVLRKTRRARSRSRLAPLLNHGSEQDGSRGTLIQFKDGDVVGDVDAMGRAAGER
jgi:glycosyltransferase involved in cell wall biosynthesis